MTTITGGTVKFGRRKNLGDYNQKDVSVELTFTVEEDQAPELDSVIKLAVSKAEAMLGDVPPPAKVVKKEQVVPASQPAPAAPAPSRASEDNRSISAIAAAVEAAVDEEPPAAPEPVQPEVPKITDDMLLSACSKAQSKLKSAAKIKELIVEYVGGPPKKVYDIEQEKRNEFLEKLARLAEGA